MISTFRLLVSTDFWANTKVNKFRGFTLLEVLVAMSIFAMIGLGANKMLRTMINTHEITRANNRSITSMVRVFNMMERDFSQIVMRRVRDGYGEPLEPLMIGTGPYLVELTRTGWNNPAQVKRSVLQRVAYQLEDKKLIRHFWLVLDRAQDSEPVSQELLTDVEDFRINLLDEEGKGTDSWPDLDASSALPLAVEILLETEYMGEIRRVFALTSTVKPITRNQAGDGNRDGSADNNPGEAGSPGIDTSRDRRRRRNNADS